jgi:uncharacterized protein YkwD
MTRTTRWPLTAILILSCPLAGRAPAQTSEEENREKITVPDVPDKSGKRPDLARAAELIIEKTNAFRKEEGRAPVKPDEQLTAAARYFARWMAEHDEYGHTADGRRPAERAKAHGYDYCIVLENIAYAFDSGGFETVPVADQFFTGWKESPGHRKNMLDPDVTQTAVAVARSEKTGYYYAVQMFGRPKSQAIEFKIENRSGVAVSYTLGDRSFELSPRMIRTHTRCRPAEAKFRRPGDEGAFASIKPADGERFAVTQDGDKLAVKKR